MRKKRIVLENHPEAAALWTQLINPLLIQPNTSVRQLQQPGEAIERRRLAATGRPKQGEKLT